MSFKIVVEDIDITVACAPAAVFASLNGEIAQSAITFLFAYS
jgi:hypothetical protein